MGELLLYDSDNNYELVELIILYNKLLDNV